MRSVKNRLVATFGVLVCAGAMLLAPAAAQAATVPAASAADTDNGSARGPIGPCSDQNSGIRVTSSFDGWTYTRYFQNCNNYGVNIQTRWYSTSGYWGSCFYLAPGQTRTNTVDGINTPGVEWQYC